MFTTLLRMNSLTSAKQLYKHLIKESRKLPKDTQAYYRNYIRQVNIKQICNSLKNFLALNFTSTVKNGCFLKIYINLMKW
jgi:type IV secretory pathway component VirB8